MSQFGSERIHDNTNSCSVFKFHTISRREVSETMHCFGDKAVQKLHFSPPFFTHLVEGAKSLQGSV